jgi:heme/copper-type cytochrome/quinol oxidase subunit 2
VSASLGVMSNQGRNNHSGAYLDWAWWIGLIGLIITIICLILLIIFIVDTVRSNSSKLGNNHISFNQMFDFLPMLFNSIFVTLCFILAMVTKHNSNRIISR